MNLTTRGLGTVTPRELAEQLRHDDGEGTSRRPGRRIRAWLRDNFPDHPPRALWHIPPDVAARIARELSAK